MDTWAVKRSTARCWGFTVGSFGLWTYFWFYTYRRLLDGELGDGRDDAVFHTVGLIVPILNLFIVYWLWRDLNELRRRVGLGPFPDLGFLIGSIFLAPVFYSLANQRLNEYWDTRSQGHATDAPVTTNEKIVTAAGAGLFVLWILFFVLILTLVLVSSSGSS